MEKTINIMYGFYDWRNAEGMEQKIKHYLTNCLKSISHNVKAGRYRVADFNFQEFNGVLSFLYSIDVLSYQDYIILSDRAYIVKHRSFCNLLDATQTFHKGE